MARLTGNANTDIENTLEITDNVGEAHVNIKEELPILTSMTIDTVVEVRQEFQDYIDNMNLFDRSRALSLAITKLEESKMWLGKYMGELGGEDLNAKRDAL